MSRNSSGAPTGGALASGTRERLQVEAPLRYQNDASLSARRRDLFVILADVARQLRPYAIGRQEYHALTDAMRGRLSGRTLYYLTRIAARSPEPWVLENGVQEAVLNASTAPVVVPCAHEASEAEQRTNEALNLVQLVAAKEQTPERWLHVAELCQPQEHATRQLRVAAIVRAGRSA